MGIIRLLLALSVVLAHSAHFFGIGFVGGPLAVQSFFIISGFYMSLILNEKYIGQNGSYKLFISNRLIRLYPIYWAVFIVFATYSVIGFLFFQKQNVIAEYAQFVPKMTWASLGFLLFTNLTMFFQDIVMFLGLNTNSGSLFFTSNFYDTNPQLFKFLAIPQAWSIGIELSFYLIAPFLVRRSVKVVFSVILFSFILRFIAQHKGLTFDPWTHRFFPFELAYFLTGNIVYRVYKKIELEEIKRSFLFAVLTSVILAICTYSFLPEFTAKHHFFLALFAISLPFVFKLTKKWKTDTATGELSYPVYIVHVALIDSISANPLIIVPLSIMAALILNELVAKPVEKYRQSRLKKPLARPVVTAQANLKKGMPNV